MNKVFGVSQRSTGKVGEDGLVTDIEIISYDLFVDPGFSIDFSDTEKIKRELARQELLKTRREKLNKLNNI